ncbi:MAG: hypothetical protein ACSW8K_10790 [bacterium]
MKKTVTKRLALLLAAICFLAALWMTPGFAEGIQAATSKTVYWNPNSVFSGTWKPDDSVKEYYGVISIMGCTSKDQIKNLKSSDKSIASVTAHDGFILVKYGNKSGTVTISCRVRKVDLSHKFRIRKYTNPFSRFKLAGKGMKKKFDTNVQYTVKEKYYQNILNLKVKSGWKIQTVVVENGNAKKRTYNVNAATFRKRVNMTSKKGATITVTVKNTDKGIVETIKLIKKAS